MVSGDDKQLDKQLEFLLARCAAEVDRANRFVSRLSTDAERPAMAQRNRLLPDGTCLTVHKRASLIARQDPEAVATIIRGWLAGEYGRY
jgi:flagellar biosynthesis/type III secretory pathway M-ring protein FliF/YscJ